MVKFFLMLGNLCTSRLHCLFLCSTSSLVPKHFATGSLVFHWRNIAVGLCRRPLRDLFLLRVIASKVEECILCRFDTFRDANTFVLANFHSVVDLQSVSVGALARPTTDGMIKYRL